MPSELSQTVENLRADLAISINKIAELEKAKAEAERAAEQAEQAKLDAENAKQEVERARIAERMTSNALVAQVRADKVAAGVKSARWENALYGSIGGLIVVLTALAIGFPLMGVVELLSVTALAGGVLALVHLIMRQLPHPALAPAGSSLVRRIYAVERWRHLRYSPLPYGVAIACGGIWATLSRGF